MKILDVNVILAAHRADHPQFAPANALVDRLAEGDEPFSVPDAVAGAFLRLATNRRVFPVPASLDDAFAFLRALRAQPGHVLLAPGARHLDLLERVCREAQATGDLLPDAQLAALATEHAAEIVSFDRDFARFEGLRWTRP